MLNYKIINCINNTIERFINNNLDNFLNKIIIIYGPTCSNKSTFAANISQYYKDKFKKKSVIINSDAFQIYKEIPIITSQIQTNNNDNNDYKLYGFISLKDDKYTRRKISVADWINLIIAEIKLAKDNDKIPILVGGTGMYIYSLINGLTDIKAIDENSQKLINDKLAAYSLKDLHSMLQKHDDESARKISQNDQYRIMRALSVYMHYGIPLSVLHKKYNKKFYNIDDFFCIFIKPDRKILYDNINKRFEHMIDIGAVEEVKNYLNLANELQIKFEDLPPAIGLKEIKSYILGENSLNTAILNAQMATRHYAKRQYTWFNKLC